MYVANWRQSRADLPVLLGNTCLSVALASVGGLMVRLILTLKMGFRVFRRSCHQKGALSLEIVWKLCHYTSRTDNIVRLLLVVTLSCCFHMLSITLCAVSSWYWTTEASLLLFQLLSSLISLVVFRAQQRVSMFLGMCAIYFLLASGRERSSIVMFRIRTIPNYHAFLRMTVMMMIIIDLYCTCHNDDVFLHKVKHLSKKTSMKKSTAVKQSLYNKKLLWLLRQQTDGESEINSTQDVVRIPSLTPDICNPI